MFTVTRDRILSCFFFFNATSTTDIYTYLHTHSLHDALPISSRAAKKPGECRNGARDGGIVDIQMGDHADVRQVADRHADPRVLEMRLECGQLLGRHLDEHHVGDRKSVV